MKKLLGIFLVCAVYIQVSAQYVWNPNPQPITQVYYPNQQYTQPVVNTDMGGHFVIENGYKRYINSYSGYNSGYSQPVYNPGYQPVYNSGYYNPQQYNPGYQPTYNPGYYDPRMQYPYPPMNQGNIWNQGMRPCTVLPPMQCTRQWGCRCSSCYWRSNIIDVVFPGRY